MADNDFEPEEDGVSDVSSDGSSISPSKYKWSRVDQQCPVESWARWSCSVFEFKGKLFVFGGQTEFGLSNQLYRFDRLKGKWRPVKTHGTRPERSFGFSATVDGGGLLWVFGGFRDGEFLRDLHVLDLEELKWARREIDLDGHDPEGFKLRRCSHAAAVVRNELGDYLLFIVGGVDDEQYLWHGFTIDLRDYRYQNVPNIACKVRLDESVPPRRGCAAVSVGNIVYVVGGQSNDKSHFDIIRINLERKSAVREFDASNQTEYNVKTLSRRGHSVVHFDQRLYIFGGLTERQGDDSQEEQFYDDMLIYHLGKRSLSRELPVPPSDLEVVEEKDVVPSARACHGAALFDFQMVVFGGADGNGLLGDMYAYDLVLDKRAVKESQRKAVQTFAALVDDRSFSDVVLVTSDGQRVHSHRAILAARSEYFRAMFSSDMIESSAGEVSCSNLSMPMMQALLKYLYCGEVTNDPDIAFSMLALAAEHGLPDMFNYYSHVTVRQLSKDNVVSHLIEAENWGWEKVRKACISFLATHFSELREEPEVLGMPGHLLSEVLREVTLKDGISSLLLTSVAGGENNAT